MSFKLMAQALDIKTGSPLTKLILLKLCDNANDAGECWPSYQTIADHTEVSKRSVMIHIQKLIDSGLLKKELRREGPKNKSNLYSIDLKSSESPALGSESPAPPPSAAAAPEPISLLEPINESFNTFWIAYPKKVMKGNAETTFKKILKTVSLSVLLAGVKGSPQLQGSELKYMPNAQAWLNGKGWLDENQPKKPDIRNHDVYS
jgi:DNA-binding transcriptional ArsR family regulator